MVSNINNFSNDCYFDFDLGAIIDIYYYHLNMLSRRK